MVSVYDGVGVDVGGGGCVDVVADVVVVGVVLGCDVGVVCCCVVVVVVTCCVADVGVFVCRYVVGGVVIAVVADVGGVYGVDGIGSADARVVAVVCVCVVLVVLLLLPLLLMPSMVLVFVSLSLL